MADVDLDDLYNQGDTAEGGPAREEEAGVGEAEAAEPTGRTPVTHEELLQQLRTKLQELRDKFASAEVVPDYVDIAAQAKIICARARAGAQRKALAQQTEVILDAAAQAAAEGKDPLQAKVAAVAQAAALQRLTNEGLAALLPTADDGVTCLLLHVSPQHSSARLSALVGRYGPEPARVYKEEGRGFAVLVFGSREQREAFVTGFNANPNAAASEMELMLPEEHVPEGAVMILCGKRRREMPSRKGSFDRHNRDEQRREGVGARPQQPRDIRSVVCPWWNRPYHEQLKGKMETVMGNLRHLTEEVNRGYMIPHVKPDWLQAALKSPNKTAAELPGIVRSPQLDGYRNKAEFSVGLDAEEKPMVGFLQGNYVDGHTQVVDPSGCPHMSPTSLAYAAAFTEFLRGPECSLPPWDKRAGKGFWRLLVVREGRDQSFLPLPAVKPTSPQQKQQQAAAADADAAANSASKDQQQRHQRMGEAPDPPVLPQGTMAELPVEKWVVRNPLATPPAAEPAADAVGVPLTEVYEGEAPAPAATQVMVMVQINPLAAPDGPTQIKHQLTALETALKETAVDQGLALTSLAVQYHSGVANAAPATAPFTAFGVQGPVAAAAAAAGGGGDKAAEGAAAAAGGDSVLGITDALCELKFKVSPTAFYQVNAGGTCLLYHTIGKLAGVGPNSLLLDVCCGTGTIGLTLAKQVAAVVGIDNVRSAIDDAEANAQLNSISNTTFVCGPAEKVMEAVLQEYAPKYEHMVAVVDPPRAGLHKDVLIALLTCPALKRLVYASCNPETLVQNAKILCGRWRPDLNAPKVDPRRHKRQKQEVKEVKPLPKFEPFRPTKAMAFDLFPHTAHVEAVVLFERD